MRAAAVACAFERHNVGCAGARVLRPHVLPLQPAPEERGQPSAGRFVVHRDAREPIDSLPQHAAGRLVEGPLRLRLVVGRRVDRPKILNALFCLLCHVSDRRLPRDKVEESLHDPVHKFQVAPLRPVAARIKIALFQLINLFLDATDRRTERLRVALLPRFVATSGQTGRHLVGSQIDCPGLGLDVVSDTVKPEVTAPEHADQQLRVEVLGDPFEEGKQGLPRASLRDRHAGADGHRHVHPVGAVDDERAIGLLSGERDLDLVERHVVLKEVPKHRIDLVAGPHGPARVNGAAVLIGNVGSAGWLHVCEVRSSRLRRGIRRRRAADSDEAPALVPDRTHKLTGPLGQVHCIAHRHHGLRDRGSPLLHLLGSPPKDLGVIVEVVRLQCVQVTVVARRDHSKGRRGIRRFRSFLHVCGRRPPASERLDGLGHRIRQLSGPWQPIEPAATLELLQEARR